MNGTWTREAKARKFVTIWPRSEETNAGEWEFQPAAPARLLPCTATRPWISRYHQLFQNESEGGDVPGEKRADTANTAPTSSPERGGHCRWHLPPAFIHQQAYIA